MFVHALNFVDQEAVNALNDVKRAVDRLEAADFPDGSSCHTICRAIATVYGLVCVDGYITPHQFHVQHSWCKTRDGHIIDVYPPGVVGGPILVERNCQLALLYKVVPGLSWDDKVNKALLASLVLTLL